MNRGRGLGKTREYSEEEAAVLGTKGCFLGLSGKMGRENDEDISSNPFFLHLTTTKMGKRQLALNRLS